MYTVNCKRPKLYDVEIENQDPKTTKGASQATVPYIIWPEKDIHKMGTKETALEPKMIHPENKEDEVGTDERQRT